MKGIINLRKAMMALSLLFTLAVFADQQVNWRFTDHNVWTPVQSVATYTGTEQDGNYWYDSANFGTATRTIQDGAIQVVNDGWKDRYKIQYIILYGAPVEQGQKYRAEISLEASAAGQANVILAGDNNQNDSQYNVQFVQGTQTLSLEFTAPNTSANGRLILQTGDFVGTTKVLSARLVRKSATSNLTKEISRYDGSMIWNFWGESQGGTYNRWEDNGAMTVQSQNLGETWKYQFHAMEGISLVRDRKYKAEIDIEVVAWGRTGKATDVNFALGANGDGNRDDQYNVSLDYGRQKLVLDFTGKTTTDQGWFLVQTGLYDGQVKIHSLGIMTVDDDATFAAGQSYTFISDQNGGRSYEVVYVAQGGEKLRANSSVSGYTSELHVPSATNGNGYFYIPLSYGSRTVTGTLTMTGGADGGTLQAYADDFSGSPIATVTISRNAVSATEVTIPAHTRKLVIKVTDPVSVLGMKWNVSTVTNPDAGGQTPATEYVLNYNGNGAEGGEVPGEALYAQGAQVTPAGNTGNLYRTGYTFLGWATTSNATSPQASITMSANTTLYAVWRVNSYKLTYSASNGGQVVVKSNSTTIASGSDVAYGTSLTLQITPDQGKQFDRVEINGGSTNYADGSNFNQGAYDINLCAFFKDEQTFEQGTKYTVRYDANGADSGNLPADPSTVNAGDTYYVLYNVGNLAKKGHMFTGWKVNNQGTCYGAGSGIQVLANYTLYAQWEVINYGLGAFTNGIGSLTVTDQNGENVIGQVVPYGSVLTIHTSHDYTLSEITFNGEPTALKDGDSFTMPAGYLTIGAIFDGNSPIGSITVSPEAPSDAILLPSGKELEITFDANYQGNSYYDFWSLLLTNNPSGSNLYDEHLSLSASPNLADVYTLWSDVTLSNKVLYNLTNNVVYTANEIPQQLYLDMANNSHNTIRVSNVGDKVCVQASISCEGREWYYTTTASRTQLFGNLYAVLVPTNEVLTNLTTTVRDAYVVTTSVSPASLAEQAHVRLTTPEGISIASGTALGMGRTIIAASDYVDGYTFTGWGSATNKTDNPLTLAVAGSTHLVATYAAVNKPVVAINLPDTIYLGGNASYNYAITSNSTGAFAVTQAPDASVASVAVSGSTLTVTPVGQGSTTFTLHQRAADGLDETDELITINVHKRATTLTLDNYSFEALLNSNEHFTTPVPTVTYIDDNGNPQTVPVSVEVGRGSFDFVSNNTAVANYDNGIQVHTDVEGSANVIVTFRGTDAYAPSSTSYHVAILDGAFSEKWEEEQIPDIAQSDGLGDYIKYTFGGWQWNEHSYQAENATRTDAWKVSPETFLPIDGFTTARAGANDAKDEALLSSGIVYGGERTGWFKPQDAEGSYPYTIPVRGAYMTFEPSRSGTLSVYLMQNGTWALLKQEEADALGKKKDDIKPTIFRPHPFFIVDENGNNVPGVIATTQVGITDEYQCTTEGLAASIDDYSTDVARWNDFRNFYSQAEQQKIIASFGKSQQDVIQLDNGSWIVVQKGLVKYTFHVTAGETYYIFSNFSKLAFAGCNFKVDAAEPLPSGGDLALDDTQAYQAPSQKTMYNQISVNRNFKQEQWSTICLPFYMSPDEVAQTFGPGTQLIMLQEVRENNTGGIHLQFVLHEMQGILAGYPYLIYPKQDVSGFSVLHKLIDPAIPMHSIEAGMGYVHTGVTSTVSMARNDIYMGGSGTLSVASGEKAVSVKGYRSYIQAAQAHMAPLRSINIGYQAGARDKDYDPKDDANAIEAIEIDEDSLVPDARFQGTYTISGAQLGSPVHGVVIQNGKLILIK